MGPSGTCEGALGYDITGLAHESITSLAFAVIGVVTALGSVLYLRRQQNLATSGAMESADTKRLIFPIYFYLLVALAVSDVYHAIVNIAYAQEKVVLSTKSNAQAAAANGFWSGLSIAYVLYALSYGAIHTISEGIALLLMRRGLGSGDVWFAVKGGMIWVSTSSKYHYHHFFWIKSSLLWVLFG